MAYTKYDWINRNKDNASVSIYTESPVQLLQSKQSTHSNFLYKVFMDHARNNNRKQKIGQN